MKNFTSTLVSSRPVRLACALPVALLALCGVGHAQAAAEEPQFKLTVGAYHFSQSGQGIDTNLRHTSQYGTTWLAYFHAGVLDVHQLRAGWERSFGRDVRVLPSLQLASNGFAGGSINVETGERWFAGAGLGRTNLRPYYSLNFDPNDAWSLTGGYRVEGGASYTVGMVRDNRLNPDQRHLHAIYRAPLAEGDRITLDLLYKSGLVAGASVHAVGVTATYDWPRFFVRLAYDPYTNFTPDHAVRLSVGTRF